MINIFSSKRKSFWSTGTIAGFVVAGYGTVPSSKNLSTHRSLKGMSEAENRLQKIFKILLMIINMRHGRKISSPVAK